MVCRLPTFDTAGCQPALLLFWPVHGQLTAKFARVDLIFAV